MLLERAPLNTSTELPSSAKDETILLIDAFGGPRVACKLGWSGKIFVV